MLRIKHFIRQSWLLIVASFCFGLLIAIVSVALSPRIERNKTSKIDGLMASLLPKADSFELAIELQIESARGKKVKSKVYKAVSDDGKCLGWSFNAVGPGFADKIELIVAVDENFEKIAGFNCLASNETPGFGDQIKLPWYRSQFAGAPVRELRLVKTGDPEKIDSEIVAISGATVSSRAVVDIINNSLTQVKEQMQAKGLISDGK
jgi:electron transport complex protein RnfG